MQDRNLVDVVIYHGTGCMDGFASAMVVWMYYEENNLTMPEFQAMTHEQLAKSDFSDLAGKNVIMCDIAPKFQQYCRMKTKSILIIDHHEFMVGELKDVPSNEKIFDSNKSGCVLTWEHFYERPVPLFLAHIQANDLWQKMPNTEEFIAGLSSIPRDFAEWAKCVDDMAHIFESGKGMMVEIGLSLECLMKNVYIYLHRVGKKYHYVAYVNSPRYKSLIGSKLLEKFPWISFSCVWHYDGVTNATLHSLRSNDTRADVSEVAAQLGGGGHRNASGIRQSGCQTTLFPRENDYGVWRYLNKTTDADAIIAIPAQCAGLAKNANFVDMLRETFPSKKIKFKTR